LLNKEILDIARELGKNIKDSYEYKDFLKKEADYENDSKALNIQEELDEKNKLYKKSLAKSDEEKVDLLNIEIKQLNEKLMEQKTYLEYINSKSNIKKTMKNINNILEYYTGISEESNCGGCNKGCNK